GPAREGVGRARNDKRGAQSSPRRVGLGGVRIISREREKLMNPLSERALLLTRRHFFGRTATGIGVAALASLLDRDRAAADPPAPARHPGVLRATHFPAKAKRVI